MRSPNGAKMDPKSALFLRVKIMRIHCKKQGWGGIHLKHGQKLVFVFCKKLLFHNPAFRLNRKLIFQVYGPFFTILEVMLGVFFRDANLG